MRIREARIRDAEAIINLIPGEIANSVEEMISMIQSDASSIFVATDFSANILGCIFDKDKVFVKSGCNEPGIEDALKACI